MKYKAFLAAGALWLAGASSAWATITPFFSAGPDCTGASSAPFTPGGTPVQVSLCVTTTTENVCGATLQLEAGSAAENGHFLLSNRSLGGLIPDANAINLVYPVPVTNPRQTVDLGGTVNTSTPPLPATNQLLATFSLNPQSIATNASYVISLSALSSIATDSTNCFGAPADQPISASVTLQKVVPAPPPSFGVAPTAIAFGGQSMGTTSPARQVTITNSTGGSLTITGIGVSQSQFLLSHSCGTLAPGSSCPVNVFFSPDVADVPLNGTVAVSGQLNIATFEAGNAAVALAGTAEKSLVTHFYRAILNRAPDGPGKDYWESEAARLAALEADIAETLFVMAGFFFNSAEYLAANKTDAQFVTDLYNTFFNRPPDQGGLDYWTGQIAQGLPREVVLFSFMFSPEFKAFTVAILGSAEVRPEVNMVIDFFRGILNRLPDTPAFEHWVGQLRLAQCDSAGAVYAKANELSFFFIFSQEYVNRQRTNTQFVTDMYYSFLRRGGDPGGVNFWINQLNIGAKDRNTVRADFIASPEFGARVNAVIAAGCLQ